MKNVFLLLGFALLLCAVAMGQNSSGEPGIGPETAPPPLPAPNVVFHAQTLGNGRVATSYLAIADNEVPVTGAPYSATATTETTQVLADGNRIVNKSSALLARDSQGRTRREEMMGSMGPLTVKAPKMAFINDPVAKTRYLLNLDDHTASQLPQIAQGSAVGSAVIAKRLDLPKGAMPEVEKKVMISRGMEAGVQQQVVVLGSDFGQVKTESLGTQEIEGVIAEGKRLTRTIPAGQIGNERPVEITTEVWTSPDLHLVVLSKRDDPRFGETVYKLTNINRAEPDPALFQVPANFTIMKLPK